MFLFLFLWAYLPPTFPKETGKDLFNFCLLVGSFMYFKLGGFKTFTYFFVIWRPCLPYKNSDFAMLARKDSSPSCGPAMNGSTSQVPIPTASAGLYSQ